MANTFCTALRSAVGDGRLVRRLMPVPVQATRAAQALTRAEARKKSAEAALASPDAEIMSGLTEEQAVEALGEIVIEGEDQAAVATPAPPGGVSV